MRLAFERRGSRTVLTERQFRLPLQALEAMDLDGSGAATLMLLNPTGGLLGGDVLETSVTLGAASRVCLTTPAASRVYRTAGAPAVQRFIAAVGEGAVLEYVPDHLIPSPGARLRQSTEITLAEGATALLVDAWAVGRLARGEAWQFSELDVGTIVRGADRLLFKERSVLGTSSRWDRLGGAEGMGYVATFAAMAAWPARWDDVAEELRAALDTDPGGARWGVGLLPRCGLVARLLAPSAPVLQACVRTVWTVCRRRLLGLEPLALRKL